MILTGPAIRTAVENVDIVIDPFDPSQLGPNAYDFRLGERCIAYSELVLDAARPNRTEAIPFGVDGLLLDPSRIRLFNTFERMGSRRFVPIIRGRSSVGRLGIFIDITADLIDLGSINRWTLQLHVVQPVRVYPGMLIGQVTFWATTGDVVLYSGKYARYESPVASLSYLDFDRRDADP